MAVTGTGFGMELVLPKASPRDIYQSAITMDGRSLKDT